MASNDYDYFQQRAEAELEQAQQATHVKVAKAHYQLAEAYLARVSKLAPDGAVERRAT